MVIENVISGLLGGVLIGLSASLLLLLKGRIFGVSGIVAGVLSPKKGEFSWRLAALLGLMVAGGLTYFFFPDQLFEERSGSISRYVLAGLLVGFGTQLGSGCTSGHGVCGMSRMSGRSIVATISFIVSGMLMVFIIRAVGGSL